MRNKEDLDPTSRPAGIKQRYRRKIATSCQAGHGNTTSEKPDVRESKRNVQRKALKPSQLFLVTVHGLQKAPGRGFRGQG